MERTEDLNDFAHACWKDVFLEIRDAAVYIDHAAAECLHWYTGDKAHLSLKNAGAISVHELSLFNLQYVKAKGTKKAVVISTSAESSFYKQTLRIILEKNSFSNCTIICAVHSSVLNYNTLFPLGNELNQDESKQQAFSWVDNKCETQIEDTTLRIIFRPIFTATLNENIFVTPPFGNLMSPIDEKSILDNEVNIDFFVSSMHSLFTNLNFKEDIYSVGRLSDVVSNKLANLPAAINRRRHMSEERGVSLIFLDRSLDLCTACTYNTESVLGRILCTLPHLNHHGNDVAVNMSPLCPDAEECLSSFMVPGCLATNDTKFLNLLLNKKQKDLLLAFNKTLIEMSTIRESPSKTKFATRVSAHSLEKLIHKIRDSESIESLARSSKTLQIIIAAIQAFKSNKTAQLELLVSLEKLVLQNLAVSRDASSIVAQLSNVIKSRSTRGLDMENLLVLLIYVYSLAGTEISFPIQQEEQLRKALAEAIFEDIKKCNEMPATEEISVYHQTLILLGVTDNEETRKASQQLATQIMELLHVISSQRQTLQNYKPMISKPNYLEIARSIGLVERLLTDLIDPNKPEIPDLQCKTSSLLSAGFSLLTKGRAKHPSDNSWIIIYILGGITAEEARIVEEKISLKRSNYPKITLAGSRLLNPLDVLDKILLSNINTDLN